MSNAEKSPTSGGSGKAYKEESFACECGTNLSPRTKPNLWREKINTVD